MTTKDVLVSDLTRLSNIATGTNVVIGARIDAFMALLADIKHIR